MNEADECLAVGVPHARPGRAMWPGAWSIVLRATRLDVRGAGEVRAATGASGNVAGRPPRGGRGGDVAGAGPYLGAGLKQLGTVGACLGPRPRSAWRRWRRPWWWCSGRASPIIRYRDLQGTACSGAGRAPRRLHTGQRQRRRLAAQHRRGDGRGGPGLLRGVRRRARPRRGHGPPSGGPAARAHRPCRCRAYPSRPVTGASPLDRAP